MRYVWQYSVSAWAWDSDQQPDVSKKRPTDFFWPYLERREERARDAERRAWIKRDGVTEREAHRYISRVREREREGGERGREVEREREGEGEVERET